MILKSSFFFSLMINSSFLQDPPEFDFSQHRVYPVIKVV